MCSKDVCYIDMRIYPSYSQLSRIDEWDKQIQENDLICNGREDNKNILSNVNFQDFVMSYYDFLN